MRDVTAGGDDVRAQVRSDIDLLVKNNKSRTALVSTASRNVHNLTVGRSRVFDAAVEQLKAHHSFSSESAARADLLGNMEILRDLLDSGHQPTRP